MDNKYKIMIPNILTLTRIILTPIIIILGVIGNTKIVVFLVLIAAITDFFDGRLARKWNTVSNTGAKLDAVADKIFVIGLVWSLIKKFTLFKYILILEIIIGSANLYYHYKSRRTESLYIGKIKTALLFTTIVIGMISILLFDMNKIVYSLSYTTINLQILSIICYLFNYLYKKKNKPKIEDNQVHNEIMHDKDLEYELDKTMIIDNLRDFQDKIFDVEKDDIY
ncbi:MAG: CDP-alcohol phosphatidyltransferase family protein [Bacilli bacterium]|nr:CDP-alcohol phosphatidyltransferase family protein [Bacilli bacterium]